MSEYTISLRNGYSEFDLQKVADENIGQKAAIVHDDEGTPVALLLSVNFLAKFKPTDNIVVAENVLSTIWGNTQWRLSASTKLRFVNAGRGVQTLTGFRYVPLTIDNQVSAITELHKAITHLQSRKVVKIVTF